jgi:hypothetical protein
MGTETTTVRYEVRIPDWHPATKNELQRSVRSRIRLKKQDRGIVWLYARDVPRATGKRRVSVTFVYGPGERMRDVDAYDHSLFDALKQGGLILNDSPKWLERGAWRFIRGAARGTVLVLEDCHE